MSLKAFAKYKRNQKKWRIYEGRDEILSESEEHISFFSPGQSIKSTFSYVQNITDIMTLNLGNDYGFLCMLKETEYYHIHSELLKLYFIYNGKKFLIDADIKNELSIEFSEISSGSYVNIVMKKEMMEPITEIAELFVKTIAEFSKYRLEFITGDKPLPNVQGLIKIMYDETLRHGRSLG
jgi:hypothetical protein